MRKKQQIEFIVGMKSYATKNNDQQEGTLTKINKDFKITLKSHDVQFQNPVYTRVHFQHMIKHLRK